MKNFYSIKRLFFHFNIINVHLGIEKFDELIILKVLFNFIFKFLRIKHLVWETYPIFINFFLISQYFHDKVCKFNPKIIRTTNSNYVPVTL